MEFQTLQEPTDEALDEHLTDEALEDRIKHKQGELAEMAEMLDRDDIQALEVAIRRDLLIQTVREGRRRGKLRLNPEQIAQLEAALIGFDEPY